jgi:hypothetical protein
MVSTVVVLWIAKRLNYITFPNLQRDTVKKIWPLPVIYAGQFLRFNHTSNFNLHPIIIQSHLLFNIYITGNMMTGLGGTQQLRLNFLIYVLFL